mmetsp:Transcript_31115/g.81544  ORF Transcript_31115/g.81544 Transcript_31115/m.81544 type:complete len:331 (-) Transcript_31115:73-1065(-)
MARSSMEYAGGGLESPSSESESASPCLAAGLCRRSGRSGTSAAAALTLSLPARSGMIAAVVGAAAPLSTREIILCTTILELSRIPNCTRLFSPSSAVFMEGLVTSKSSGFSPSSAAARQMRVLSWLMLSMSAAPTCRFVLLSSPISTLSCMFGWFSVTRATRSYVGKSSSSSFSLSCQSGPGDISLAGPASGSGSVTLSPVAIMISWSTRSISTSCASSTASSSCSDTAASPSSNGGAPAPIPAHCGADGSAVAADDPSPFSCSSDAARLPTIASGAGPAAAAPSGVPVDPCSISSVPDSGSMPSRRPAPSNPPSLTPDKRGSVGGTYCE